MVWQDESITLFAYDNNKMFCLDAGELTGKHIKNAFLIQTSFSVHFQNIMQEVD